MTQRPPPWSIDAPEWSEARDCTWLWDDHVELLSAFALVEETRAALAATNVTGDEAAVLGAFDADVAELRALARWNSRISRSQELSRRAP